MKQNRSKRWLTWKRLSQRAGLLGLLLATLSLGWQMCVEFRDQAELALISQGSPVLPRPISPRYGHTVSMTAPIGIMNIGKRPMTILSADFNLSVSAETDSNAAVIPDYEYPSGVEPKFAPKFDPAYFPMKLDAGGGQTINVAFRFELDLTHRFKKGFTTQMLWTFQTTLGELKRRCSVFVPAAIFDPLLPDFMK